MASWLVVVGLFLTGTKLALGAPALRPTLLTNARLINIETGAITPGQILIEPPYIAAIGAGVKAPSDAKTIDLDGGFVLPSFYDMHVHAWGNPGPAGAAEMLGILGAGDRMVKAGVGAYLDLFNDEREIFTLRDKERKDPRAIRAHIFAAGACLSAPFAHCTRMPIAARIVESPAGGAAEVREIAKMQPDVVKLVYDHAFASPTMSKDTMKAIVSEAAKLNLRSVVHIGTWQDAREAVLAGATAITHLDCSAVIPNDLVALIASRQVAVIPTVAVQTDLGAIVDDRNFLKDPLLRRLVHQKTLDAYTTMTGEEDDVRDLLAHNRRCQTTNPQTIRRLSQAQVHLLAGTDVGNLGTFVGYSLHRELEHYVGAGLTPLKALQTATLEAARFLGQTSGLQAGGEANFMVLHESPLAEIKNTKTIRMVFHRGSKAFDEDHDNERDR